MIEWLTTVPVECCHPCRGGLTCSSEYRWYRCAQPPANSSEPFGFVRNATEGDLPFLFKLHHPDGFQPMDEAEGRHTRVSVE